MLTKSWWKFRFILLFVFLIGCQSEPNTQIESTDIEERAILIVDGWKDDYFVRSDDSLKTAFEAMLRYYNVSPELLSKLDISIAKINRNMPYGISYQQILEDIANHSGTYATFVSLSYQQVKEELAADHPVIARRILRDVVFDYVVIVGLNQDNDTILGITAHSKNQIEISQEMWEKDFYYFGDNWSVVFSQDLNVIQKLNETSQPFFLQLAADTIRERNYPMLHRVIDKLQENDQNYDRLMYINAFYYLIVTNQLTDAVDKFIIQLYENNPSLSYANEFMFHKYRILGDEEQALIYMDYIIDRDHLESVSMETLDIFKQISIDNGNTEQLALIENILLDRGN